MPSVVSCCARKSAVSTLRPAGCELSMRTYCESLSVASSPTVPQSIDAILMQAHLLRGLVDERVIDVTCQIRRMILESDGDEIRLQHFPGLGVHVRHQV